MKISSIRGNGSTEDLNQGGVYRGTVTDKSGTIANGGTKQTLAVANPARTWLYVQNQHATADLWINFTTDAVASQPSIKIAAGQSFEMKGFVSTELVSVIGGTSTQPFAAKEGS